MASVVSHQKNGPILFHLHSYYEHVFIGMRVSESQYFNDPPLPPIHTYDTIFVYIVVCRLSHISLRAPAILYCGLLAWCPPHNTWRFDLNQQRRQHHCPILILLKCPSPFLTHPPSFCPCLWPPYCCITTTIPIGSLPSNLPMQPWCSQWTAFVPSRTYGTNSVAGRTRLLTFDRSTIRP